MSKKYFGTDGIRGRVGTEPMTPDFAMRLGYAAGQVLCQGPNKTVLIGKDTRRSGYMIEAAMQAGLIAAGAEARLLGPIPTPGVAYLTRASGAAAGVVISASHNPHYDNGVKFFSAYGEKLIDATEHAIEAALEAPFRTAEPEQLGRASRQSDAGDLYLQFVRSVVPSGFSLQGRRIVLDCAHGATYKLAPLLFQSLGAEVHCIGNAPDGFNINAGVGSTHPEALQAAVREHQAELGIAFDGDGDRVLLVDAEGVLLDGDDLLHILAVTWKTAQRLRGPVVGTLMTNIGLERALARHDIGFERAKVGDRYVHQRLLETGGVLGGEASGHILCLDQSGTGDAMIAALLVLEALAQSGQSAAEWRRSWQRFPQQTINVRIKNAATVLNLPVVQHAKAAAEAALQDKGRLVLRASGTEPLIRVTVEAESESLVEAVAQALAEAVSSAA